MLALEATGIAIAYRGAAGERITAVDIDRLEAKPGRLTVITGPSGSGKSTLLYLVAGIEKAERGVIRWGDTAILSLSEAARDAWRRRHLGFIFQNFHLIEELSPRDNVLLPAWFERWSTRKLVPRAETLLEGLGVPLNRRRFAVLSRGEQQRVAIARALLFDPPVILADEPTASLDREAGRTVITQLSALAHRDGRTVIAVSHDAELIAAADETIRIERGRRVAAPAQEAAA